VGRYLAALLVVLAVAACNQVYGLSETITIDAAYFDAPPRGIPHCPALGETLVFSPVLHQLHFDCIGYNASADVDLAVARCRDADSYQLYSGPRDGPFAPVPELPVSMPDFDVTSAQLDPEGATLLVATFDLTNIVGDLRVYHRTDAGWVRGADVASPPARASTISRGPDHRMLGTNGASDVTELSDASGSWQPVNTHTLSVLGVPSVGAMWLSADALGVLFVANAFDVQDNRYMAYAQRAATSDPFGAAIRVSLPVMDDPFITEDCGRLYFSGLHSIFYAESP
jgi:hypothetical protein